ncbi:hypothetical protein PoB_004892900 [Plakobranchus ocellatus]|uniref:Uncharacterized protein n=1 Tax=Plakobranchus ocellatus TaxID=259542 RepID=A0AAV4BVI2_9GAST|nr:hypothetical protein PoB_004892900 [Plakobranchus ocellatus]
MATPTAPDLPAHEALPGKIWPDQVPMCQKLYESWMGLQSTAAYIERIEFESLFFYLRIVNNNKKEEGEGRGGGGGVGGRGEEGGHHF